MGSALSAWLRRWQRVIALALAMASILTYALYFVHLRADFPNFSPWNDWSKTTDEGWYASGAVHHFVLGRWYTPGAFNPAVAIPVWSAFADIWFHLAGFGMVQLRVLGLLVFGVSTLFLWLLVRRQAGVTAATLAVALLVLNPFLYSFDRLAILEPLIVFWMLLAWILAGWAATSRHAIAAILLGLSVTALLLTKTTGVFLIPSIAYYFLQTGRDFWKASRNLLKPALIAGISTCVSFGAYQVMARPFRADSDLLFTVNSSHVHLSIVPRVFLATIHAGTWIHPVLFPLTCLCLLLAVFFLKELWRLSLFGTAVIAAAGYLAFILYHNNLQPRYYLVITPAVSIVIVLTLQYLQQRAESGGLIRLGALGMMGTLAITLVAMSIRTVHYVIHPEYTFLSAMQQIQAAIQSEPGASPMVVSNSGDDLSLFTGIPSICDAYVTAPPEALLQRYRPGWYAVILGTRPTRVFQEMQTHYRLEERARYLVFDDPKHNVLVLYRLLPAAAN